MKRLLLPLVATCLMMSSAKAQKKPEVSEPLVHKMANGLQIQVYNTKTLQNDLTEMLGIKMWKIRMSSRLKGTLGFLRLEIRTPGQATQSFGAIGGDFSEKADFVFGFQPIDGDNFSSAPKLRIYRRASFYHSGVEDKYPGDSKISPNPLFGLGGMSMLYEPSVRADGSILLMTFKPSNIFDDSKNSELVVVATLQDPPLAK